MVLVHSGVFPRAAPHTRAQALGHLLDRRGKLGASRRLPAREAHRAAPDLGNSRSHGVRELGALAHGAALRRLAGRPDTATTHLAAATGTPTVALFGPSNPVKWGPWPRIWTGEPSPYAMRGSQVRGNVALVHGEEICVPCLEEGCFRHVQSPSECLRAMTPEKVIAAIETLLRNQASRARQR